MKTHIKTIYYFNLISSILAMVSGIVGIIVIAIFSFEILNIDYLGIPLLTLFIIGFLVLIIFSIKEMIPLLRDYNDLKNKNYKEICGKVIGFKKNTDPDTGVQINSKPIVQIDTQNFIVLKVNVVLEVGKIYNFNYLNYSKIAEDK